MFHVLLHSSMDNQADFTSIAYYCEYFYRLANTFLRHGIEYFQMYIQVRSCDNSVFNFLDGKSCYFLSVYIPMNSKYISNFSTSLQILITYFDRSHFVGWAVIPSSVDLHFLSNQCYYSVGLALTCGTRISERIFSGWFNG